MFKAFIMIPATAFAILLVMVKPYLAAIYLFFILCFFAITILTGRCYLLTGKDECEIYDIYSQKEEPFHEDSLWQGLVKDSDRKAQRN